MTAAHDWRHDTGPLDFGDPAALAADPYLRDLAGRFRPAARDELSDRYHPVPAPRCPHGSFMRWAVRNCRPCRKATR